MRLKRKRMYLLFKTSNEDAARCDIYIIDQKVDAAFYRVPHVRIWAVSSGLAPFGYAMIRVGFHWGGGTRNMGRVASAPETIRGAG